MRVVRMLIQVVAGCYFSINVFTWMQGGLQW
jgi:hypothetical protein